MPALRLLSADDHLQEPRDLWQERLPGRLRDRAPKLVDLEDGGQAFAIDGQLPRKLDVLVSAGQTQEEKRAGKLVRWEDIRPGFYEPEARLADMDLDGVEASVLYPNVLLDLCMNQVTLAPEVYLPAIQVYNDHLSEFCSRAPERLVGIGVVPLDEVATAVKEMERIAAMKGLRGALLPIQPPGGREWWDPELEPIFAAAADLGLVLSIHTGKPRWLPRRPELAKRRGGMAVYMHYGPFSLAETFSVIFWTGYFARYPNLRMVSVEGGIGWLGFFKWRAQDVSERHGGWLGLETSPSEWFGRNFFATFEQDPAGIRLRDLIGVEALLWAADYPHTATSFPHSRKAVGEIFSGVPEEEKRKIVGGNMARLYGLEERTSQ